mgnify:CR=1 FL=1
MMQLAGIMLAGAVVAFVCLFIGLTIGLLIKQYGHNKRECRACLRRMVECGGFYSDGVEYKVERR